jgi:hypothetical protein
MELFLFLDTFFFVGQVGVDATAVDEFLSGTNGTEEIVAAQRILQALNIHRHLRLALSLPLSLSLSLPLSLPPSLSPALHPSLLPPSLHPCPALWLSLCLSASLTPAPPLKKKIKKKSLFLFSWVCHEVLHTRARMGKSSWHQRGKKNEHSSSEIWLFPLCGLEIAALPVTHKKKNNGIGLALLTSGR